MKIWEDLGGFGKGCFDMTPGLGEGPKSSKYIKNHLEYSLKAIKCHSVLILELIKDPLKFRQNRSTLKIRLFGLGDRI